MKKFSLLIFIFIGQCLINSESHNLKSDVQQQSKRKTTRQKKADRIKAVKTAILQKGKPVRLTRPVLYKGRQDLPARDSFLKGAKVFPAYKGNMLVNGQIFQIQRNVAFLEEDLSNLKNKIKTETGGTSNINQQVKKNKESIERNKLKITEILKGVYDKRGSFYDSSGQLILLSEIKSSLSRDQVKLVNNLDQQNTYLKGKNYSLMRLAQELDKLSETINQFYEKQKQLQELSKKTNKNTELENKLLKLKTMYEKGLLSKEVYDDKIAEIIDLWFFLILSG